MVLTANIKIRISKRKKKCIMTNDTNSKFKEVIYSLMQCIMTMVLTANIKIRISKRKKKMYHDKDTNSKHKN